MVGSRPPPPCGGNSTTPGDPLLYVSFSVSVSIRISVYLCLLLYLCLFVSVSIYLYLCLFLVLPSLLPSVLLQRCRGPGVPQSLCDFRPRPVHPFPVNQVAFREEDQTRDVVNPQSFFRSSGGGPPFLLTKGRGGEDRSRGQDRSCTRPTRDPSPWVCRDGRAPGSPPFRPKSETESSKPPSSPFPPLQGPFSPGWVPSRRDTPLHRPCLPRSTPAAPSGGPVPIPSTLHRPPSDLR